MTVALLKVTAIFSTVLARFYQVQRGYEPFTTTIAVFMNARNSRYPLVHIQKAIENCPLTVDLPMKKWWFSVVMFVYQRVDNSFVSTVLMCKWYMPSLFGAILMIPTDCTEQKNISSVKIMIPVEHVNYMKTYTPAAHSKSSLNIIFIFIYIYTYTLCLSESVTMFVAQPPDFSGKKNLMRNVSPSYPRARIVPAHWLERTPRWSPGSSRFSPLAIAWGLFTI